MCCVSTSRGRNPRTSNAPMLRIIGAIQSSGPKRIGRANRNGFLAAGCRTGRRQILFCRKRRASSSSSERFSRR